MTVMATNILVFVAFLGMCRSAPDAEPTLESLALKIQALESKVTTLESNQNSGSGGPIAFTASVSKTIENTGSHQHIVFDNVITNVGNSYHRLSGHFIAPVRGVYAFHVSLTNVPQHSASAQLMKNGVWIGNVLAHGSAVNHDLYVTSSLAVTVQLQSGDEVWVQNEMSFSGVEEIDGYNFSYFTGHLIMSN